MAIRELSVNEIEVVSGGDRNLGTLYQYTGNPDDRTRTEIPKDWPFAAFDFIFGELY